jgi:hypothetical protein
MTAPPPPPPPPPLPPPLRQYIPLKFWFNQDATLAFDLAMIDGIVFTCGKAIHPDGSVAEIPQHMNRLEYVGHYYRQTMHAQILDIVIAMAPLDLPTYILLWIIEWLPRGTERSSELQRISLITNIVKSIRRVKQN